MFSFKEQKHFPHLREKSLLSGFLRWSPGQGAGCRWCAQLIAPPSWELFCPVLCRFQTRRWYFPSGCSHWCRCRLSSAPLRAFWNPARLSSPGQDKVRSCVMWTPRYLKRSTLSTDTDGAGGDHTVKGMEVWVQQGSHNTTLGGSNAEGEWLPEVYLAGIWRSIDTGMVKPKELQLSENHEVKSWTVGKLHFDMILCGKITVSKEHIHEEKVVFISTKLCTN